MTPAERDAGDAILAAAAGLFGERGYRGTTTRAIAERAGVNEVTLFRRFGNKQGVLRALAASWAENMAGFAVGAIPETADTRGTLEALARLEVEQAARFGAAAIRLAIDATSTPEVAEVLGGGPGENAKGLARYLAERQAAGDLRADVDPRVMSDAFFALTSTLVMSRGLIGLPGEGGVPVDEAVAGALEILFAGIGLKERSS